VQGEFRGAGSLQGENVPIKFASFAGLRSCHGAHYTSKCTCMYLVNVHKAEVKTDIGLRSSLTVGFVCGLGFTASAASAVVYRSVCDKSVIDDALKQ